VFMFLDGSAIVIYFPNFNFVILVLFLKMRYKFGSVLLEALDDVKYMGKS
jgi:hypothetical protein